MTSMHAPTPEFERYLEWQVTTALRRQDRFARPSAIRSHAYLAAVPIVLLSALIGAGGVMAAGRRQQNQEKQLLSVQQQGELQLAEMQVSVAQKSLEDTKRRADTGIAPPDDLAAAERVLRAAMLDLQRVKLSVEEVQLSGRAAQDDVTAPLVHARDFVLERAQLDQQLLAAAAAEAEKHAETVKKRFDAGLAAQVDLLEAQTALMRQLNDLNAIKEKMALRQRFISGDVSAEVATRQRLVIAAQYELRYAEAALDLAAQRASQIDRQKQLGVAGDMDVLKARLEMMARQQDIARLRERLVALQKGGPLPDGRR